MLPIVLLSEIMGHFQVDFYTQCFTTGQYGSGPPTLGLYHEMSHWSTLSTRKKLKIVISHRHSTTSRFILYYDNGVARDRRNCYGYHGYALACGFWRENGVANYTASHFGGVYPVASRRSPILAILQKYTKNFSLFRCGHGDYVIHYHYFGVVTLLAPYERRRVAQFWTNQGKDQGFMDQIGPYTVIGTPDRFVYPWQR